MTPLYWEQARRELARRDPVMRRLTRRYRGMTLTSRGDAFATLARSIVGQQISLKAAQSVWERFARALGPRVCPAAVLRTEVEALRACGLSQRKAEYLFDLAQHFRSRALRVRDWPQMSDEEVVRDLTRVRGIGRWTAEMFLIFNLLRPDVLPLDDLGLLRAAGLLYCEGELPTRSRVLELAQIWRPWCSVATWHLWRSLDPLPVEY
jgi:DNA-3-methyladenine glycosylase II